MTNELTQKLESLDNEMWLPVVGFEESYEVSNLGRVRSKKRHINGRWNNQTIYVGGIVLKPRINKSGYYQVTLSTNNKTTTRLVHRLVAQAFLPFIEGKDQVNHMDANKLNNHLSNLEWCNPSGNRTHAIEMGLIDRHMNRGSKHPSAKLSDDQVRHIKSLDLSHKLAIKIGHKYGVSHTAIYDIWKGRTWAHISTN